MSTITLKKSKMFAVLVVVTCFLGTTPAYAEKELDHGFDHIVKACENAGAEFIEESADGVSCTYSNGDEIVCEKGEGCVTFTQEHIRTKPTGQLNRAPAAQRVAPSMIQSR